MEKYTQEFKRELDRAKSAIAFMSQEFLSKEATVKIENTCDKIGVHWDGNLMAQLYMMALATVDLLSNRGERFETLFLAAVELEKERQREMR